ncbi:DUF4132 domain-containing protein [Streptomyces sp. NPDC021356]|uniref:DUF4132 domain-containing protein n=1 Tax=Streptomyces sp. NPDC021356 TaxID=3154900 RepID=UPI0033C79C64
MGWVAAGDDYEIALDQGRVVARAVSEPSSAAGSRSLPAELRDRPEVIELERLAQWLERHAADCAAQVGTWVVSSLPVPTVLLARVWPDEAWRSALRDLVVVGGHPDEVGFLRDADASGHLRLVAPDGGTVVVRARTVTMPHPILLPELETLRARAGELGAVQGVEQLHRAVWHKPVGLDPDARAVTEFAGAEYSSWFRLSARATALGYKVAGQYATDRIREAGRVVTASVAIGDPYTEEQAWTGGLAWGTRHDDRMPLADVGPVAWSEGMRMAAALHAGGRSASVDDGAA